jgi:hypothetical protein
MIAACSSDDAASVTTAGDDTGPATEAADPNEGSHRYRYIESFEHPENNCSTSAEVGDELTQITTFEESLVTIVFMPDDMPEGVEPGLREYDEQVSPLVWREVVVSSDGEENAHTIEFTDSGVIMSTIRDGADCFYSVRDRVE